MTLFYPTNNVLAPYQNHHILFMRGFYLHDGWEHFVKKLKAWAKLSGLVCHCYVVCASNTATTKKTVDVAFSLLDSNIQPPNDIWLPVFSKDKDIWNEIDVFGYAAAGESYIAILRMNCKLINILDTNATVPTKLLPKTDAELEIEIDLNGEECYG